LNDSGVNRRIAGRSAAAALGAAAIALISFDAPAVYAQSIMRTPNLNVGSRTPTITTRINPNVAGRTTANTATIAGRGAGIATTTGNIAGRGNIANTNIANTAVGRTTTNVTTTTAVGSAKLWINIDHHPSNPRYGDLVYIDSTAPATGQILFELLTNQKFPITPAIAENLYAAISTDTGSFQYPNTTVRTFEIAGELVRCGVDVGRVSQLLYENFPRRRIELLRDLLATMRFACDGKLAYFSLSQASALALGVIPEDNEGLIDHLRAIRGVVVAIFFEELTDGKVRVSMRSKNEAVDVCAICTQFGGGGHVLAAGARVRGTLAEVEKKIVEQACAAIERNT